MYTYEDAVKQLQETGSIGLINLKELPYEDLDELLEEIKKWCVYANGDNKKLKKSRRKIKRKIRKRNDRFVAMADTHSIKWVSHSQFFAPGLWPSAHQKLQP